MAAWIEEFRAQVEAAPSRVAVVSERGALTYNQLWDESWAASEPPRFGRRRLIVDDDPLTTLTQLIRTLQAGDVPAPILGSVPTAVREGIAARLAQPAPEAPDQDAAEGLILTTSGSTGEPKQVVLPRRVLMENVRAMVPFYARPPDTNMLLASSLCRPLSLFPGALVALVSGWTLFLFKEGTPPPVLQRCVRSAGVHVLHATPSFYRLFLAYWKGEPFNMLARISVAGEATPPDLLDQMLRAFPNAQAYSSYGCTEAGSRITLISALDPRYRVGGVGQPMPYYSIRIRPVEGLPETVGELLISGPTVFLGYLAQGGSYEGLDADGFFPTGDLVERAVDGCLFYRGRKDGVIKVGGHRVNAFQTESAIRAHPGVAEVRCFAQPHAILGSILVAEVQVRAGHTVAPDEIVRHCTAVLEPQQVPREVRIVEQVERTAAGKVSRMVTE